MAKSIHASCEFLYVFYVPWWSHVKNCLDFRVIWAYAEQYAGGNPENTFFGVKCPFVSVLCLESPVKVVDQSAGVPSFYDDVIYIGLDQVLMYLVMETLLDGMLICSFRVFLA